MKRNGIAYTILFAFLATFVLVVPLALANEATRPIVAENRKAAASKAILEALGQDTAGKTTQDILAAYASLERLSLQGGTWQADTGLAVDDPALLYRLRLDDGSYRYARFQSGAGLWGTITVAIGFNTDASRIVALKVYSQVETPGLGSRIEEGWYTAQFRDQSIQAAPLSFSILASAKGDLDKDNNTIDAISGATRSSEGLRDLVNAAIKDIRSIIVEVQP